MQTICPSPGTSTEANDFYKTLVTIKIYDEDFQAVTNFAVSAALITSRSDFCKAALKQCWQQDSIQTIHIWNRDPMIFAMYLGTLHGQTLDLQLPETGSATDHAGTNYIMLFKLYVLAEFLQDRTTTEALMKYLWDALFTGDYTKRSIRSAPCVEALHILYSGTMKGCAARRLIVDTFAHADLAHIIDHDEIWPEEFARELVLKLYGQVDWKGGKWSNTDGLLWRLRKEDYFEAAVDQQDF